MLGAICFTFLSSVNLLGKLFNFLQAVTSSVTCNDTKREIGHSMGMLQRTNELKHVLKEHWIILETY